MTTAIATRNANPLPNKVIHADFTIQGIEDLPSDGSKRRHTVTSSPATLHDKEDEAFNKKAQEMRANWEECIGRDMHLPDGYSHVAVLLIKWADELDELDTAAETQELEALFRDRFKYETKIVELNVRQKPQHQLKFHVDEFIMNHDGPQNLLIVYYTGHGTYNDEKKGILNLTATLDPVVGKGFSKDAKATWNNVEATLKGEDVEGDVLTILDTCYSSNLVKSTSEEGKKFELLSACAIDQTTPSPGEFSFTRALIDASIKLLEESPGNPISTYRLIQRINLDPRRADTPSFMWSRGQTLALNEAHVLLAPLKKSALRPLRPKSFLTLRLGLKQESLDRKQIEFMTKALTKAFNSSHALVGLRRADWIRIEPAPPISQWERVTLVMYVIKQWKGFVVKRKENLSQRSQGQKVQPQEIEVDSTARSQKRAYDSAEDQPPTKRPNLGVVQPPLSPVSNSSRMEED